MDSNPSPGRDHAEASLASLIRTIRRWRRPFLVLALGLPFVTAIVMLLTPNRFTAIGTVLVETPTGGGNMVGSELLGQIRDITGFSPQVPPTEMYMAILKSRRVSMAVVDSLDLSAHYDIESDDEGERMEATLLELTDKVDFDTPDLVSISISATDKEPQMAADIVNTYLMRLETANQTLALSRARRTRRLVAEALRQTVTELDSTRAKMQAFQERYGVFSIEKQTEGTLDLIGTLQAELLQAQTERDAMKGFSSESSSQVRNLDLKIAALRSQIEKLVMGHVHSMVARADTQGVNSGSSESSFFLPLGQLPSIANQYATVFMDLKVQEAKYNVLATQLEQTRIEESQSIPSFEILDWAHRPYRKSGPMRTITVLAALIGGIIAGVLLVILLDDLSRRVDDETRENFLGIVPGSRRLLGRWLGGHNRN